MPQTQAYYENGAPIPEAKLTEALARGEALFEKGAAVKMRDAYGKLVDIPAEDIHQAFGAGFSLESSEGLAKDEARKQYGESLPQTALAAAEGAGRGLTFGLSDVAGAELGGDEYRQAALARQQHNPVAAGAGEIAGAVAPVLLSGGTGLGARGVAAAGALPRGAAAIGRGVEGAVMGGLGAAGYEGATALSRAAARTAALGLSGAAEGSLYGAGKAISDTALNGEELTAEKVLSSMGGGALYGGAAGALLGGAGSLLSSGIERAAGEGGVKAYARQLRDESVMKAIGAQKSDLNKIAGRRSVEAADKKLSEIANDVFEYKFEDGRRLFGGARTPEEMAGDMSQAVDETGSKLRAMKTEIDTAAQVSPELAPDMRGWLDKVDHTVLADMKRSTSPTVRQRAASVEKELSIIRERLAPPKTPEELAELGVSRRPPLRPGEPIAEEAVPSILGLGPDARHSGRMIESGLDAAGVPITGTAEDGTRMTVVLRASERGKSAEITGFDAGTRGVGQGKKHLASLLDGLERAGVERVKLTSQDVGRYFWAKAGFPAEQAEFQAARTQFLARQPEAAGAELGSMQDIANAPGGKEFLLSKQSPQVHYAVDVGSPEWQQIRDALPPAPKASGGAPGVTFAEADQIRRDLRSAFQPPRPASGGVAPVAPEHAAELERAERLLAETIADSGEKSLAAMGKDPALWRETNRKMSNLLTAEAMVNKASRNWGNRAISPSDYAMGVASGLGALASGNVGALATGAAGAIAHKMIRERGRSVVAQLADRVARFDATIGKAADVMAGLEQAPKRAVAPVAVEAGELSDRYRRAADAVSTMAADPRAAVHVSAAVTQHYADTYPDLAGRVQQQVLGDVQYLAGQLPQQLTRADASLTPTVVASRVPAVQMRKFLAAVDALDNPSAVVEKIAHGELPERTAIEALKTRRPQLFNELRTKVVIACLKRNDELSYQRRIALSLVFDFRGDKSLDPQFMQAIQGSFVRPPPAAKAPSKKPNGKSGKSLGEEMQLTPGVENG